MRWHSASKRACIRRICANSRAPTSAATGTPDCNNAYSGTDCGYNVNPNSSEMGACVLCRVRESDLLHVNGGVEWYLFRGREPLQHFGQRRSFHQFSVLQLSARYRVHDRPPAAAQTQFSSFRPGTRSNSRRLLLTSGTPSACACAAIHRSLLPMGVPAFCKVARISP